MSNRNGKHDEGECGTRCFNCVCPVDDREPEWATYNEPVEVNCNKCQDTGEYEVMVLRKDHTPKKEMKICEECCDHSETENGHCVDCGNDGS